MESTKLHQKLKKLREDRDQLTRLYEEERIKLNKEIQEIVETLRVSGRESELARIIRAEPHVALRSPTSQEIRIQINRLVDGDPTKVENITISGGDLDDLIFYLEKELEKRC